MTIRILKLKLEKSTKKIEHLNLALRAVRNVNRLIAKEKDCVRLLKGIGDILIKNRGYDKVWLVVLDDSGKLENFVESNIDKDFIPVPDILKQVEMVDCAQRALKQKALVLTKNPFSFCTDCPLSTKHAGWGVMTVPLVYKEKVYGLLFVSIPKELISDDIEQEFIEDIAEVIAFGLYRIKREEEHQSADATLKKRVEELNYVFAFSKIVERQDISLEEIIQRAVDLIPSAMQFSERACAQIFFENKYFRTANYKETYLKLSRDIISSGEKIGLLEAGYIDRKKYGDRSTFLDEEKQLITSIASRIGKTIERKRGRAALEKSEKRFRNLVENSLTCISIIQDNRIIYQNPEHMRLFGVASDPFIQPDYNNIYPDDIPGVKTALEKFVSEQSGNIDIEFRFFLPKKNKARMEIKWMNCRLSKIEHKGKDAILANLMDVSHTKELEHLLRIQGKMTSLGRVAAGIAHEIRNPLSGINIYLKAMEKVCTKIENQEKVSKILFQLQSASNKIESVIKRVMDFSKPSEPNFMMININQPVEEAINLSAVTLRKSEIQLDVSLALNLPKCNADSHMIEQVMLNLITNASEAMRNMDSNKRISIATLSENEHVCIEVCDSGPGVPEHLIDTIFDPFYTTKKHSSGIGLSISHRIISDHGGVLDVLFSDFGGAKFMVRIPCKLTGKS